MTDDELIRIATELAGEFRPSEDCVAGGVASALITRTGKVYTGICIDGQFVTRRGKGSHGTLFYGERFTIVRNPKDELKTGTLYAMLNQLGLRLDDL